MLSRLSHLALLSALTLSLTACSLFKPYQAELNQGNFIRAEQIEQLEPGQTSDQVAFILGTPLLTGESPQSRWIYPALSQTSDYDTLIIEFENGLVSAILQK